MRIEDEGVYRATYTAFDGASITPQLIETDDFRRFRMSQLVGPAAQNKGMALFPRRVDGRYLALSRWDRENNSIASSRGRRLVGRGAHPPDAEPSMGAAADRQLRVAHRDRSRVGRPHPRGRADARVLHRRAAARPGRSEPGVGALREPLLAPDDDTRDGYVPNVVYSCGALRHDDQLLLPYGASDASVRFALVALPLLIDRLTADGPPDAMRANNSA